MAGFSFPRPERTPLYTTALSKKVQAMTLMIDAGAGYSGTLASPESGNGAALPDPCNSWLQRVIVWWKVSPPTLYGAPRGDGS